MRRNGMLSSVAGAQSQPQSGSQIEGEFPELLGIKESLIKYVFEPNAAKKDEVRSASGHCAAAGACMLGGVFVTCMLSHDQVFAAVCQQCFVLVCLAGGQGSQGDARPLKPALDSPQDVPGLLPGHWQSVRCAESGTLGVSTRAQNQQLPYGRKSTAGKCSWLTVSDGCCTCLKCA